MNARTADPRDDVPPDGATLRIPPQSREAEQSVLGGLLLDNGAFDRVGDLLADTDFYRSEHRAIYAAIAALAAAGKPADVVTVHEQLGRAAAECGGLPYLNALAQSVPSASNARRYAEIVRERSMRRALIATLDEASALAWRAEGTPAECIERATLALDELHRRQAPRRPQRADELVRRRLEHHSAAAAAATPPGAPTGLARLDAALNGGLQPGRVYVVAARPSVGKSALALQIAAQRARAGDGVLVLSQEMPADECIDRVLCATGGIDYGRMQRAQLDGADWNALPQAGDEIAALPLWIDDQPALTLRDVRAKAHGLRRDGLRLLVLDYLQLSAASDPKARLTRSAELGEVSRGLKAMAKELRISVLLLSQLNREVEKRSEPVPTLADLRDSGEIEQDADAVLLLWQAQQWRDRTIVGMLIAKNRQGERGQRIALEFAGATQRWRDSDADVSPRRATKDGFE